MPPTSLASELDSRADALMAAAEEAGLARVRPRSSPERRRWECEGLLALCAASLGGESGAKLAARVRRLVREGALAAASFDEADRYFRLWTQVLTGLAARSAHESERLAALVASLRKRALAALRRWESNRIDLVLLGASAGGVDALSTVIAELDARLAATVLVVLHISGGTPGILPQVLGRHAELPIESAAEGSPLWLGHAYVAAPGLHLTVRGGALHLDENPPVHHTRPSVDVLFRSAAGPHVVSAVLSGTGGDGAQGTAEVRRAGGVALAQTPASAQFTSMPESAVATGMVQRAASPAALGMLIARLVRNGRRANPL